MSTKKPHPKAVAKSSLLTRESYLLTDRAADVRAAYAEYCDEREVYVNNAMMRAKSKNGRIMPQSYEDAIFLNWSKRRPFAPRAMDVDELEAKLASLNEELFGEQCADHQFALDALDKRHLRQEIASIRAQIAALTDEDEYEEQQEDPVELIAAAEGVAHTIDATEAALKLLNSHPTTAAALSRANLSLIVLRSAKQAAEEGRSFTTWTEADERDLQQKTEVVQILTRF